MSVFDAYLRTMDALGSASAAGMARPLAFAQAITALEAAAAAFPRDLREIALRIAGDCRAEPKDAARLLRRAGARLSSIGRVVGEREAAADYNAAANALLDCANAIAEGA